MRSSSWRWLIPAGFAAVMAASLWAFLPANAQFNGAQTPDQTNAGVAVNRSTVNHSVTITTGGTFQQLLPSIVGTTTVRQSLTIQNNNPLSGTEYCYVFLGTTSAATEATSMILGPGGSYQRYFPFVPSDAVQVTCTTTSDTIYADTQ